MFSPIRQTANPDREGNIVVFVEGKENRLSDEGEPGEAIANSTAGYVEIRNLRERRCVVLEGDVK